MIRINKPAEPPRKLLKEGVEETRMNEELYNEFGEEFRRGARKFLFKDTIYAHRTVKEALRIAQHNKCCFCERKEEIGAVEHFRPKSGYQQDDQGRMQQPGYYWLAYRWDNLFFCCPTCNSSYKRNFFPLADESLRARCHSDDLPREEPLFIDPFKDDPEIFIEYIGDKPCAIDGNPRGKTTIQRAGLDRPFLDENRFRHYKRCKDLYRIILIAESKPTDADWQLVAAEARKQLEEAQNDNAEYASMVRCAVKNQFRY